MSYGGKMHIIAIDPGKHACGLVESHGQGLSRIDMVSTEALLTRPGAAFVLEPEQPERVALIERPYVKTKRVRVMGRSTMVEYAQHAEHPEADIAFAMLVGRIQQAVASLGFRVVEVPAWGPKGWIYGSFRISGQPMPDSEAVKGMTMVVAQTDQGRCSSWNEHTSAAYCMLRWWLKKREFEAKCKAQA